MPLLAGKEEIGHNIHEMEKAGHPHKQAVAAALHKAYDAAAGILLTHGERALFLKRSDKARDHAGEWCCPGGSLEDGETDEQAARREMQEETGLTGLVSGDLTRIDEGDGFVTFRQNVDEEPAPSLNDEHTEFKWAPLTDPPQPLHPGVASTLKKLLPVGDGAETVIAAQDKREYDDNNWYTVLDNPLSGVGVYEYAESSVISGGDRTKMVGVFRPPEELSSQECIDSFKLMPWTDDHPEAMLGDKEQGLVPAEEKGVHGVIGEQVYYKDGTLYGNIKVFSETLARKIAAGKRQLSVGYHCQFIPAVGVYKGKAYQFIQRTLRGNHLASVKHGKMGDAATVLDSMEFPGTLSFALDLKETPAMRKDEQDCSLDAETEAFIADSFNTLVGKLEEKGYSKGYATKVAGKVAAEKGMTGHDSTSTGDTTVAKDSKGDVKDPEGKDDPKKEVNVSEGTKDMTEEQEAGMDAAEEAKDAEEEKADEKKDDKEATDRRRARDRRAGARDARKMARDRAKDARDAKAAKDAMSKKGMDASEVTALVEGKLAGLKVPTAAEIVAQVRPAIRKEEAAKAALYGRVSHITGAFDHAEMTHEEMATYALDKLGAPKGASDPVSALDFYLAGRAQVAPAHALDAMDSAPPEGSFMAKYLNS